METRLFSFNFTEVFEGRIASILRIEVRVDDCVHMSRCIAYNFRVIGNNQLENIGERVVVVILSRMPPEEVTKIAKKNNKKINPT